MNTSLSMLAAREHMADLHRLAERRRPIAEMRKPQASHTADRPAVSLRIAGVDDAHVVRDLAALDDAPVPEGEVLIALIDGEPVAAQSLRDGHVVADPFVHTTAAVALLGLRADHLSGRRPSRRRRFVLHPRVA